MTNTIVTQDWSIRFGMSDDVRVCALRTSVSPAGYGASGHTSVRSDLAPVQKSVRDRAMGIATADAGVDVATTEDSFPGTSAWSPPI